MMAFVVPAGLVGCCALNSASGFNPARDSGVSGEKSLVRIYRPGTQADDSVPSEIDKKEWTAVFANVSQQPLFESCGVSRSGGAAPPIAAAAVPILAALGELVVNLYAENQKQRIQDIVDSAQATYGVTTAVSPTDLSNASCLLFVRYAYDFQKNVATPGLVVLSKLSHETVPSAGATTVLTFQPIYVRSKTLVAVTRQSDAPTASISIALSVKAVARQGSQVLRLLPTGEGVVTVAKVALNTDRCGSSPCKRSDLIPFPTDKGTLSVAVSITEQGVTGFNDKAAQAELAAIKDAIGPAVSEAIKARFGDN
jgi:hypothetical protein